MKPCLSKNLRELRLRKRPKISNFERAWKKLNRKNLNCSKRKKKQKNLHNKQQLKLKLRKEKLLRRLNNLKVKLKEKSDRHKKTSKKQ